MLIAFGVGFAIGLQFLVKRNGDLSQGSVYEASAISETPSKASSVQEPNAKAGTSLKSSPTELSTQ